MCIVTFDLAAFRARYPEFSTVSDGAIEGDWTEATLYLDNTDCSLVTDCTVRAVLLNMLTAHITALYYGTSGSPATPIVGRIDQATEGTVSVHAEYIQPGTAAWYNQTKYGASYWTATAPYRTFRYMPGASHPAAPPAIRNGWWYGI